MDSEVLYSVFGIVGFSVVAYITLNAGKADKAVKSKDEMRLETVKKYKEAIHQSLKDYDIDDDERKAKKIMLLRGYSEELAFNVFFDENEVKDIIRELSGE